MNQAVLRAKIANDFRGPRSARLPCEAEWLGADLVKEAGKILDVHSDDPEALYRNIDELSVTLKEPPCSVVLVSNEVGSGVVPAFEMGRRYRDLLGEINQRVAAIADHVVLMVAGLPLALKGSLNEEVSK